MGFLCAFSSQDPLASQDAPPAAQLDKLLCALGLSPSGLSAPPSVLLPPRTVSVARAGEGQQEGEEKSGVAFIKKVENEVLNGACGELLGCIAEGSADQMAVKLWEYAQGVTGKGGSHVLADLVRVFLLQPKGGTEAEAEEDTELRNSALGLAKGVHEVIS